MNVEKVDLHAYQIIECLVRDYGYQIVRVVQHKNDLWLVNHDAKTYPVVAIFSSKLGHVHEEYIRIVHASMLKMVDREGRLLMLYTNDDVEFFNNEEIVEVILNDKICSNPLIYEEYPLLHDVFHDSLQPDDEIARIAKVVEESQKKNYIKFIQLLKKKTKPRITYVFLLFMFLGCLFTLGMNEVISSSQTALIASGAFYRIHIRYAFEIFRFITAGFVFPNIYIFAIQAISFYTICKQCERSLISKHIINVIIFSTIFTYFSEFVVGTNEILFGMIPAIFALLGLWIFSFLLSGKFDWFRFAFPLLKFTLPLLLLILLPGFSFEMAIIGFIFGMGYAIVHTNSLRWKELSKHTFWAFLVMLMVMLGMLFIPHQNLERVDKHIIDVYRNTLMEPYAQYLEFRYKSIK